MPYNYLTPIFAVIDFFKSFMLSKISKNKKDKLYSVSKDKIEKIYVYVEEEKEGIIEKNQPQWYDNCEQCFACLQWCPQKAINFREGTINCERYTHPEVKVSDLIGKTKGANKNARRSSNQ